MKTLAILTFALGCIVLFFMVLSFTNISNFLSSIKIDIYLYCWLGLWGLSAYAGLESL